MHKKRRTHGLIAALVTLVILLGLIFGGGTMFLTSKLDLMNQVTNDYTANKSLKGKTVTNILLIGQDRRPGEDRARSDSMILVSLNKTTRQITMVSFMRDMYVEIPGYGSTRINAAYAYGGMELLDQTIENNFGIQIDGNVEVDFEAFMQIIDQIGGVEIDLTAEEADYLNVNNTGLVDGVTTEAWSLTEGTNTLNAQQALAYARTRYVGNSDWERTDRQRRVITAAINKFRGIGVSSQLRILDSVLSVLTTDLTSSDILDLGMSVLLSGMSLATESYRIPADGSYSSESIDGMSVLVPNLETNRSYLQEILSLEG